MTTIDHALDYNDFYALQLDYNGEKQQLKITLADKGSPWPRFKDNVMRLLHVSAKPESIAIHPRHGNAVTFEHITREFDLYLGDEKIGTYRIAPKGNLERTFHRPLIVDETRRMGTFHKCAPYPQRREGMPLEESQALLDIAKTSIFTDFHTHSTGQISARGLLAAAMKIKPYYYPLELLKEAGIRTDFDYIPGKYRTEIPRVPFRPKEIPGVKYPDKVDAADLHKLSAEDLEKLATQMSMPADRQSTFKHLEFNANRFRYPLSKDPRLTRAIREEEASEYVTQGVRFALSSFVGIDNPHILKTLHEVAIENEDDPKRPDFNQRFMIGIPRNLSPVKMREELEKAKILMDSPYIMGIDILGYESNKTKQFVEILDEFAAWADEHKPGSFIRVHAGENDKNHDNVKDFLKIGCKYGNLNYLVGHGVYGMDDETLRLAKKLTRAGHHQLTLEFNPASNIALNNINDVKQVPFAKAIEHGLPFVISSDAAGMYHTDATQLGLSAFHAGLDAKGFAILREHQERLIEKMHTYSADIANTIPQWKTSQQKLAWVSSMSERIAAVPRSTESPKVVANTETIARKLKEDQVSLLEADEHPAELKNKVPITIIGASGASWKRLTPGQQRENAIAVDMLIHALGGNCYVVQGRNKRVGLSKVINQSLKESNETRRKEKTPELFSVGMLVDPNFDVSGSYKHLSHMMHLQKSALELADALVDHTFDHDGTLIAVGGAAYTADTILEADQRGIHAKHPDNRKMMLLLANASGASTEKADLLHPDYRAQDGLQLVKKLFENRPDLFPRDFKLRKLNELYKESAARVTHYGYNLADSAVVSNAKSLATAPVKEVKLRGGRDGA